MKPGNIELHIEELVLHGFARRDRYAIAEALERELTRAFTEQGVPANLTQGGDAAFIDAGTVELTASSNAEMTGTKVAQAVCAELGGTANENRRMTR